MRRILLPAAALLLVSTACTKKQEPAAELVPAEVIDAEVVADQDAEADAPEAKEDYVPQGEVQRWFIGESKVECVGVAPMECLRIRRAESPEWELFYDQIDGFEWEEGTRYIVEVDIIDVPNPPADASSKRYHLVRQVSPLLNSDGEAKTCTSNADCGDDEMCAGPAGCDVPWTCQQHRPCTMDLRAYCSCEGETIHGSGSCPPAPYKHAGECAE